MRHHCNSERSGTVRVYLGSHSVYLPLIHVHPLGMSRTWEFTSAIFNQQSPTDLLVATNIPIADPIGGMDGLVDRLPQDSNLGPPTRLESKARLNHSATQTACSKSVKFNVG